MRLIFKGKLSLISGWLAYLIFDHACQKQLLSPAVNIIPIRDKALIKL